ncbi:MAG: hypothetical protein LBI33_14340 [Propionibacteriaceae bacterium]|jgi:hypothetical protein|nr:hypothetical protein [Propionibacteriaceae bacterium]
MSDAGQRILGGITDAADAADTRRVSTEHRIRRMIGRPVLWWWLGFAAFVGQVAIFNKWDVGYRVHPVLVFGVVVAIKSVLVWSGVIGGVFWLVSAMLLGLNWVQLNGGEGPTPRQVATNVLRVVATIIVMMLSVPAFLMAWAWDEEYVVLDPVGPGGCTLVAHVVPAEMSGAATRGSLFGAMPGGLVLRPLGWDWSSAIDPVGSGDWSLEWTGNDGVLRVGSQDTTVHCDG